MVIGSGFNYNNYNVFDCDWFKNLLLFINLFVKFLLDSFIVIREFN